MWFRPEKQFPLLTCLSIQLAERFAGPGQPLELLAGNQQPEDAVVTESIRLTAVEMVE